jgi:hypothetical protein
MVKGGLEPGLTPPGMLAIVRRASNYLFFLTVRSRHFARWLLAAFARSASGA